MTSQNKRAIAYIIAILGLLALMVPTLRSQTAGNDQAEHFQRSFNLSTGGTLSVDNYKGTIHVTGSDTNQVSVDVNKHFSGGNDSDRKWWMENTKVNFNNVSDRVTIEVKYPQQNCVFCWSSFSSYEDEVDLEIRVPRQVNIDLDGYKPDIKVASIQGNVKIKSYKAPITIESTTGAIHVDTYKETIKLHNVNLRGPLQVSSYKADAEIDARSLGDSVLIESHKGDTVLRVPANAGLEVDYEGSRHASFRSEFPMASRSGSFNDSFRGTINQGGTHVRLRTERGSVSIEKLAAQ